MNSDKCFIEQNATMSILLNVTNVCSECYSDLKEGNIIFYDLKGCRYICDLCHDRIAPLISSECNIEIDEPLLF